MPLIPVMVETTDQANIVYDFVQQTNDRIKNGHIFSSPYNGQIKIIGGVFVIDFKPIWPTLSFIMPSFIYLAFKAGLRKIGYKGPMRRLSKNEFERLLINEIEKGRNTA